MVTAASALVLIAMAVLFAWLHVDESRRMVNALTRAGGKPRYTEYPNLGHDIWRRAFAERELASWLLSQRLTSHQ